MGNFQALNNRESVDGAVVAQEAWEYLLRRWKRATLSNTVIRFRRRTLEGHVYKDYLPFTIMPSSLPASERFVDRSMSGNT